MPAPDPAAVTPRRGLDPKVAVGVVFVAALFMSIMDTTIVNVALPSIGRQFAVDPASVGVVNVGYLVTLAVFVPLSGWLGDRYGTRRVFLAALALFTVASLLCGSAGSLDQLTVYRIFQGAAGGLLTPVGMTMLFRAFPQEERMRATRVLMLPTAVAPALGPVLGGWLVDSWSWHWVFIVNVPIGILALVFGVLFLPDYRTERAGRFDAAGFLLAAVGFGLAMYALSEGASQGWGTVRILVPAAVGLVALAALVVVELRRPEPMLALRLFRDRIFRTANLLSLFSGAAFLGMLYLFPLLMQDALGMDALHSGLMVFPEAIGVMIASQVAGRLYPRVGPRRLLVAGATVVALCLALMAAIGPGSNLWAVRVLLFVTGFAMSHVFMPSQTAAFSTISPASTGGASTLYNAQRQLGSALGVAILGTVLAAVGTVTTTVGGTPTANLDAYRAAFLVASALALVAAVTALFVRDSDAAATMRRAPGTDREPEPAGVSAA
ncbi:MDR family MFS transporter [Kitasatospora atroaurantiaca]|uniref:EmrB/QacA subfamily drug resistance transporter n=1 Tax=Kitasatospora atroaurantiaca TaxID=285545 RepID=A0A561EP14_9ACTN|nr:MDR family MFS transporter [Kitasatospora atroaurantiaca]TWE17342.1 EmrB/QacA subfamily drug resistance transporter [Kitasatospora atroaurantiaca]